MQAKKVRYPEKISYRKGAKSASEISRFHYASDMPVPAIQNPKQDVRSWRHQ
jgi:hypothetical protein